MRFLKLLLLIYPLYFYGQISLSEIDFFRKITNPDSIPIVTNGENHCNDYFEKKRGSSQFDENKFKNFFSCKFSPKRDRFYIYMLSVERDKNIPLRDFCKNIILDNSYVADHMDKIYIYQKKEYLNGFFVENLFNDRVVSFKNNYEKDQQIINNEINNFIINNRSKFSSNNDENIKLLRKEKRKLEKIYRKVITNSESDLDRVIKKELDKIVRYKIFVNDIRTFTSYSCNWVPGKGLIPYVKKEKFSEFEDV